MSDPVEQAAEAIWRAANPALVAKEPDGVNVWPRAAYWADRYREQARAVIAALGLTTSVRGPFVHGYEERLVGPWVRVGEETKP